LIALDEVDWHVFWNGLSVELDAFWKRYQKEVWTSEREYSGLRTNPRLSETRKDTSVKGRKFKWYAIGRQLIKPLDLAATRFHSRQVTGWSAAMQAGKDGSNQRATVPAAGAMHDDTVPLCGRIRITIRVRRER
jgi:hypothetical protein